MVPQQRLATHEHFKKKKKKSHNKYKTALQTTKIAKLNNRC